MKRLYLLLLGLLLLPASLAVAQKITADPTTAVAGQIGLWTITLSGIDQPLRAGDEFLVQLPMGWHIDHWPKGKKEQTKDPEQVDYVTARCSNPAVKTHIQITKECLDGQIDRYSKIHRVIVDEGEVRPTDTLTLVYGGNKGTKAPDTAEMNTVLARIRRKDETSTGKLMSCSIDVRPAAPAYVRFFAPSQAVAGQPFAIRLRFFDEQHNVADYDGEVRARGSDGQSVTIRVAGGQGVASVKVLQPGTVTFSTTGVIPGGSAETNPTRVTAKAPKLLVAWGDMHSHSQASMDAQGTTESAFRYARDGVCLDFYTCTDHATRDIPGEGITSKEWGLIKQLNAKYNDSGHFVTILAYEVSMPAPYGHHNIFFRSASEPLYDVREKVDIESLWAALRGKQAFTVPHHTGITWGRMGSHAMDFAKYGDPLEPLMEIYSLWGSSEYYGNELPYEDQPFGRGGPSSTPGQHYARDAWLLGRDLGVVGGGDDHTAHPGRPNAGVTAVLTPSLTREAIFDSLRERHTYASIGERILLSFTVNGQLMGEKVELPAGTLPLIEGEVTGTADVAYAEVLRLQDGEYKSIWRLEPENTRNVKFSFQDKDFHSSAMYYLRVAEDKKVDGTPVHAWSSPIWVRSNSKP